MKRSSFYFMFYLLFTQYSKTGMAQGNLAFEFLQQVITKHEKINSFTYNCVYYSKHFSSVDTFFEESWVYFNKDSFVCDIANFGRTITKPGEYFWYRFYDTEKVYTFERKRPLGSYTGTSNSLFEYYWNTTFRNNLNSTEDEYFEKDTMIGNFSCYHVVTILRPNYLCSFEKNHYYINKSDTIIVGYHRQYDVNNAGTNEKGYYLKYYSFTEPLPNDTFINKTKHYKLVEPRSYKSDTIPKLLHKKIETIKVANLFDTTNVTTIATKNKVILLDFWYMGCYPCMLSYPVVNQVADTFANNNKVELYSINGTDKRVEIHDKLKNYLKRFNITHNPVGMPTQQFKEFSINSYPLFVVIVNGKVKWFTTGYSQSLKSHLMEEINKGLSELQ